MQTLERPPLETLPETRRSDRRQTWSALALAAFLALVGFLALWLLVDLLRAPDYDIDVLLDDYAAAWSRGDEAALAALTTPGGVALGDGSGTAAMPSVGGLAGFRVTFADEPARVLARDDPFLVVSREGTLAVPGGPAEPVVGVFTVVWTEGGYRVVRSSWMTLP